MKKIRFQKQFLLCSDDCFSIKCFVRNNLIMLKYFLSRNNSSQSKERRKWTTTSVIHFSVRFVLQLWLFSFHELNYWKSFQKLVNSFLLKIKTCEINLSNN